MWWLVAACTVVSGTTPLQPSPVDPTTGATDTPTGPKDWTADVVVPFDDLEIFVSADAPLLLYSTEIVDLDHDGIVDLLAVTDDPTGALNIDVEAVVLGPLDEVQLPGDAWVSVHEDDYSNWITPIELTGDAWMDVIQWNTYDPTWFRPGPYDGSTPPAAGWLPLSPEVIRADWTSIVDVDGDGTSDRMSSTYDRSFGERLEITWGPVDRFGTAPDVTIGPMCAAAEIDDYLYEAAVYYATPLGDLDGDGSTELWVPSYAWAKDARDCGGFTVSLPERGVIDPSLSSILVGVPAFQVPIGDWTGDGLPELWDRTLRVVTSSPIVFGPDGIVGSVTTQLSPAIVQLTRLPFDLDGDGRTEVLLELAERVLTVVPPDLEVLTDVHVEKAWDVGWNWYDVYVDRGHAYVAVNDGYVMRRIDLGPVAVP